MSLLLKSKKSKDFLFFVFKSITYDIINKNTRGTIMTNIEKIINEQYSKLIKEMKLEPQDATPEQLEDIEYFNELLKEVAPILEGKMTQEEFFGDKEEEHNIPTFSTMRGVGEKDEKQEIINDTCNTLLEMLQAKLQDKTPTAAINLSTEDDMLGKEDIKRIMGFKDDGTALKFFRVALKYGYAIKLNKSFVISRRNLKIFLKHLEGQEFTF